MKNTSKISGSLQLLLDPCHISEWVKGVYCLVKGVLVRLSIIINVNCQDGPTLLQEHTKHSSTQSNSNAQQTIASSKQPPAKLVNHNCNIYKTFNRWYFSRIWMIQKEELVFNAKSKHCKSMNMEQFVLFHSNCNCLGHAWWIGIE